VTLYQHELITDVDHNGTGEACSWNHPLVVMGAQRHQNHTSDPRQTDSALNSGRPESPKSEKNFPRKNCISVVSRSTKLERGMR
jgi:hypothetical protein